MLKLKCRKYFFCRARWRRQRFFHAEGTPSQESGGTRTIIQKSPGPAILMAPERPPPGGWSSGGPGQWLPMADSWLSIEPRCPTLGLSTTVSGSSATVSDPKCLAALWMSYIFLHSTVCLSLSLSFLTFSIRMVSWSQSVLLSPPRLRRVPSKSGIGEGIGWRGRPLSRPGAIPRSDSVD